MHKFIPTLASVLIATIARSQDLGEIHGRVFDAEGTPVSFANVAADRGEGPLTTVADEEGRFVLKPLVPGTYTVRISFVGMVTSERTEVVVNPGKITRMNEEKLISQLDLPDLQVSASKWEPPLIDPEEPGKLMIVASQLKNSPVRKNPVAVIQAFSPDVYRAPGSDELYFRGSRSDAMVYFVDGVKVSGRLSGVPPASIARITVYTGGLPARYGDVTGGVVAIETKSYFDLYLQAQAGIRD